MHFIAHLRTDIGEKKKPFLIPYILCLCNGTYILFFDKIFEKNLNNTIKSFFFHKRHFLLKNSSKKFNVWRFVVTKIFKKMTYVLR